jgi:hypothetical protein
VHLQQSFGSFSTTAVNKTELNQSCFHSWKKFWKRVKNDKKLNLDFHKKVHCVWDFCIHKYWFLRKLLFTKLCQFYKPLNNLLSPFMFFFKKYFLSSSLFFSFFLSFSFFLYLLINLFFNVTLFLCFFLIFFFLTFICFLMQLKIAKFVIFGTFIRQKKTQCHSITKMCMVTLMNEDRGKCRY